MIRSWEYEDGTKGGEGAEEAAAAAAGPPTAEQLAAAEAAVQEQGAAVRALKEDQGKGNNDPEVRLGHCRGLGMKKGEWMLLCIGVLLLSSAGWQLGGRWAAACWLSRQRQGGWRAWPSAAGAFHSPHVLCALQVKAAVEELLARKGWLEQLQRAAAAAAAEGEQPAAAAES